MKNIVTQPANELSIKPITNDQNNFSTNLPGVISV